MRLTNTNLLDRINSLLKHHTFRWNFTGSAASRSVAKIAILGSSSGGINEHWILEGPASFCTHHASLLSVGGNSMDELPYRLLNTAVRGKANIQAYIPCIVH